MTEEDAAPQHHAGHRSADHGIHPWWVKIITAGASSHRTKDPTFRVYQEINLALARSRFLTFAKVEEHKYSVVVLKFNDFCLGPSAERSSRPANFFAQRQAAAIVVTIEQKPPGKNQPVHIPDHVSSRVAPALAPAHTSHTCIQ